MVKNWERKAKEYKKDSDYWEERSDEYSERPSWETLVLIVIILAYFSMAGMVIGGVFDNPIQELDINKDVLVDYHIKEYYPEFENCTIEYDSCIMDSKGSCNKGANVFCNVLENRDGLKVVKENYPTEEFILEDIELEEILLNKCGF